MNLVDKMYQMSKKKATSNNDQIDAEHVHESRSKRRKN